MARALLTLKGEFEGFPVYHIQLVIDQTGASWANAIAALKETHGDVVNAIMNLIVC